MPSVTRAGPEPADVDDPARPRYREATEGKASHSVKGGTWWLEDGIRQVVYSSGGKRRKVWVARWREDVLLEGGQLGPAASFGSPRNSGRAVDEAARVDEAGGTSPAGQPGHRSARGIYALRGVHGVSVVGARAADVEALDTTRLQERALEARASLLARMAAQRHRQAGRSAVRRRQIPAAGRMADGPQFMDAAVGHPRNGGRVRLSHGQSGARLNIYTHVVDASHQRAIEALERQLFPAVPSRRKRRPRPRQKRLKERGLKKRLRPQASAGGKSRRHNALALAPRPRARSEMGNLKAPHRAKLILEAPPGFEPGMEGLQTGPGLLSCCLVLGSGLP